MPGAAPNRHGAAAHAPQLDELRWQIALSPPRLPQIERQRPALPEFGAAWCSPVVWNGAVLINDAETVRALDLQTGRPMWPSEDEQDAGEIYTGPLLTAGLTMPTAGVPRFSAVVADGRYYARMGLPIATAAAEAIQTPPSQLICLDLQHAEGRLLWAAAARDVLNDPGWSFSGAPLVVDDRLYVPLRRSTPQIEIGLACLSAISGERIWERRICSALRQAPELYHLVDHDVLAFAAGLIYCETGAGVTAAVDAGHGALRWAATYPSLPATTGELSDPARRRLSLPICVAGQLFVAPRDSDRLMAFDAATGVVSWSVPAPGTITSLIGVANETLIACGDQLWAIDAQTGRRRARRLPRTRPDTDSGRESSPDRTSCGRRAANCSSSTWNHGPSPAAFHSTRCSTSRGATSSSRNSCCSSPNPTPSPRSDPPPRKVAASFRDLSRS